ncbi:cobalamin synthase [bacterium BMS3Bbin06]|nr:cobalamin synthase [bacterium BMS3Abin08]GBE33509.1 cobalamin synthase [bacterium BMS3Bbin06]HDO34690.1 adenosylcobinamide-GDP ribazoletransferase [Nitrospirota bacterium]
MKNLLLALKFLTIVPLPSLKGRIREGDLGKSSVMFPVVGYLQGILIVLTGIVFRGIYNEEISAALMVAVLILTNGGFHLDGLSDTFDALASRRTREEMLRIMKDSSAGPAGVVSVVLDILLKFLLIKKLLLVSGAGLVFILFFPAIGKWTMVAAMYSGKSARTDGLGRIFIEQTKGGIFLASTFILTLVMAFTAFYAGRNNAGDSVFLFSMFSLPAVYIFTRIAVHIFQKRFGGLTGDNLGAISELSEVFFLFLSAGLVSQLSFL